MAHSWGGSPFVGIDECQDCHVLSYMNAIYTANTFPCEHIWRPITGSNGYECDCGSRVAYNAMLAGTFNWSCPIVGKVPSMTATQASIRSANAGGIFPAMSAYQPWTGVTPANGYGYQGSDPYAGLDLERPVRETKPKDKYPRCRACDRELCADLDAYYGVDPELVGKCDPCRRRRP